MVKAAGDGYGHWRRPMQTRQESEHDVLPGLVDHEIFVNECDAFGRDTWPEACIDAPGIDRRQLHEYIGKTAVKFFDLNLGVQRGSAN
jgi:hypothetical protein